jgi:hypothetical protein
MMFVSGKTCGIFWNENIPIVGILDEIYIFCLVFLYYFCYII